MINLIGRLKVIFQIESMSNRLLRLTLFYFCFVLSISNILAQIESASVYEINSKLLKKYIVNNNQDSVLIVSNNIKSFINKNNPENSKLKIAINNIMVDAYRSKFNYESAKALITENLTILKTDNDTLSNEFQSYLLDQGAYQIDLNSFTDAKFSFRAAEKLFILKKDTSSLKYIELLHGLARVENYFSNFHNSQEYLVKALSLYETQTEKDKNLFSLKYVYYLADLSVSYSGQGKFKDALTTHLKIKQYLEKFGEEKSYEYLDNNEGIAIILIRQQKYIDAEKVLLNSYENLIKNNLNQNLSSVVDLKKKFITRLSAVYSLLGDLEKGKKYNQLVAELDSLYPQSTFDFPMHFHTANILFLNGNYLEASKSYKNIINEIQKYKLPKGVEYLKCLLSLVKLSGYPNVPKISTEDSKNYLSEAWELSNKFFGNVSEESAEVLGTFGWFCYFDLLDDKCAIQNYKQAIDIMNSLPVEYRNDIALINYYNGIANAYEANGDLKSAYTSLINSNLLRIKIINRQLPFVSESEREQFVLGNQLESSKLRAFIWRNYKNLDPYKYIADLLINDEYYGGLTLNYNLKIRKLLDSYPEDIISKYLSSLELDINKSDFSETSQNDLKTIEKQNEKRSLTKDITEKLSEFKIQNTYSKIDSKANFDGALVIFQRFKDEKKVDVFLYSCLIISKDRSVLQYLPLFEESLIDFNLTNSIKTGFDIVSSTNDFYSLKDNKQLKDYLSKIFTAISRFNNIVIIPAGKLNFINFGAFEFENGRRLNSIHNISYYNSLTEFIDDEKTEYDFRFGVIDIFSGLNYNIKSSKLELHNNQTSSYQINLKQFDDFSNKLRSFNNSWGYLPGSKQEGKTIKTIFEGSAERKIRINIFEDGEGNESVFRKLVISNKEPKIIHLSTHGFFFEKLIENKSTMSVKNPSLRSGLILSGGNNGWKNFDINKHNDDGVLTSYEISKLKFNNIKLVVLSACDTGLGDVQSDEGVFGLQRAFKIAGAEKIIMSLWKVPDLQTTELMSFFYENIKEGQTVNNSLKNAQIKMSLKYPPFYWAAFKLLN